MSGKYRSSFLFAVTFHYQVVVRYAYAKLGEGYPLTQNIIQEIIYKKSYPNSAKKVVATRVTQGN